MPDRATDKHEKTGIGPHAHAAGGLKAALLAVIHAAKPGEAAAVLDELWALGGLSVWRAPEAGLVMLTVRDPFDTDFHLGEALVTTAEVGCEGIAGRGTVLGDAPEYALLLAAVDAIERCGRQAALAEPRAFAARLKRRDARRRRATSRMAAATTVRFESMKKERVDFGSLGE